MSRQPGIIFWVDISAVKLILKWGEQLVIGRTEHRRSNVGQQHMTRVILGIPDHDMKICRAIFALWSCYLQNYSGSSIPSLVEQSHSRSEIMTTNLFRSRCSRVAASGYGITENIGATTWYNVNLKWQRNSKAKIVKLQKCQSGCFGIKEL